MSVIQSVLLNVFFNFRYDQDPETESTEEEVEPKLKYVRISNDLQNILSKDAVSNSLTIHSPILYTYENIVCL